MRQTFLTALREAEGRPLAAAVACLMLVVALVGGIHLGTMAAADGGSHATFVLCTHAGGERLPADQRPDLCCVAGCLVHAPAVAAPPQFVPVPELTDSIAVVAMPAATLVRHATPLDHRPRGPPSFA